VAALKRGLGAYSSQSISDTKLHVKKAPSHKLAALFVLESAPWLGGAMDEETWQDILCVRQHKTGQVEALIRLATSKLFDSNHLFHKNRWALLKSHYDAYYYLNEDEDTDDDIPEYERVADPTSRAWVDRWARLVAPALFVAIARMPGEKLQEGGKAAYDCIVNLARNEVEKSLLGGWTLWKNTNRPTGSTAISDTGIVDDRGIPTTNWLAQQWGLDYDDESDEYGNPLADVPGPRAERLRQEFEKQRERPTAGIQARKLARAYIGDHTITSAEHEANRDKYTPRRGFPARPKRWNGIRPVEEFVFWKMDREEEQRRNARDQEILAARFFGFSDKELAARWGLTAEAVRKRRYDLRHR